MDYKRMVERIDSAFDNWELFLLNEKTKTFACKDKELFGFEIKHEEGIALRAIKNSRLVFTYTYENEDKAVDALLTRSATLLPFMEKDVDAIFPEKCLAYPEISIYDSKSLEINDQYKIELLMQMEKTILDYDKRIIVTRNCELQQNEIHATIINSSGLLAESKKTIFTISAMAIAKEDNEVSWYDWLWSYRLNGIDAKGFGRNIAQKAISFLSNRQIDTGIYEGILSSQASSDMLEILSHSFLGENLYKDKTNLKGKEDKKCFSDTLNIMDSGLKGLDGFPFDGEGTPSGERLVVKEGHFLSFLHDNYYGRKFGLSSTGNSVRHGIKEPPKCSPRCLIIEKGQRDIGKFITNGVIIEELMGTHTANPITGDFSLGATGYLCKNGERYPFNGVIFSGNVFELFNNVKEVGNDVRFYGICGSPSLFVEGIKISGT